MPKLKFPMMAVCLATFAIGSTASAQEVRLLAFEGYADDAWRVPFEEASGCKVAVSYVGGVDEMFAKMAGSDGTDFDLVSIDTSLYPRYAEAGLLQAFDDQKLSNLNNLLPAFQEVAAVQDGEKRLGIPIAWGSQGLIYDADELSDAPTSWGAMWDPENAQRVIALDDSNNNIVMAALYLGFDDPFDLTDEQMVQVRDKLIDLKGNLLSYYAGFEDGVAVWESGAATMMLSMGEPQLGQLRERGYNAVYSIPKEGAVGWLDTWALSAGAGDLDCAHAWADYSLRPEVGEVLNSKYGYGPTTMEAEGLDYADNLVWLKPVEDMDARVRLWNEVKAATK
ncbi:putative spermidine/putrescine transport system substrate-binding protein/spermidine/putrescine transport system substrate-binding protein [Labrenzia sp. EL_208]|uniref:ABC transporter substrate-binding protein n=1 Tax=Roseibium album TaxID=311410 RepID=UPI0018CAD5FC|nr:extracellular solute-binding protein [Roseibium album]MBG6176597.1 putative spermidine/putrescine transport system substrate-binding protein/spermidine/putrescine transport system substrate-binding protein [Labrenzia sp. EL_132]MBG6230933.1 putative spermidine/putrescine transport system substrate-binding protein/spermidine/putrescine transport system substrate-binding protein [Labrenzia sp. EL_208]MCR9058483.1 extracellular solute-binding protein [Paracoccaceae bacterium]